MAMKKIGIRDIILTTVALIGLYIGLHVGQVLNAPKIAPQMTQVEVIAKSMQSVVAVYHPSYEGLPASGFYIGNGIIVTAGHVAKEEGIEKVIFEDGDEYNVLRQIVHPDYDCGFLLISEAKSLSNIFPLPDEPALEFDFVDVRRGEEVFILGNPAGFLFLSTKGIVVGRDDYDGFFGDLQLIVSDASGYGGNSGSVLLDKDGEIRGVWVGGEVSRCGSFLVGEGASIPVEYILNALNAAGLEY